MPFPLVALLLVLSFFTQSVAMPAAAQPQEGVTAPALLAASCSGCHRKAASGDANAASDAKFPQIDATFPQIYGRPAAEIRDKMLAFRTDERAGTVMNRIAKGYSPGEIDVLANYLSEQPALGTCKPGK